MTFVTYQALAPAGERCHETRRNRFFSAGDCGKGRRGRRFRQPSAPEMTIKANVWIVADLPKARGALSGVKRPKRAGDKSHGPPPENRCATALLGSFVGARADWLPDESSAAAASGLPHP